MSKVTTPSIECIETWFQRVWVEEDASAIDELFVVDGLAHGLGDQPLEGPEGFKLFHTALLELVSDVQIEFVHSFEQGDWISYLGVFRAISKETGEPVAMNGGATCRIVDGKIVEAYNNWDFISLFIGLGLAPTDTFARAMSGQSICG